MKARQCLRDDGSPKLAFASFDAAHVAATRGKGGYHAYRCADHGWHVGSNHSVQPQLQTLGHALAQFGTKS